jgi:hypothetical protein
MRVVRIALVLFAGCAFSATQAPHDGASDTPFTDGARRDAVVHDAPPDAPPDAKVFLDAPPPPPPITFVTELVGQATGAAVALNLPTATAGDLDLISASWGNTSTTLNSVTDSDGNTYTLAKNTTGSGATLTTFIAPDVKQGSGMNTVTLHFSGNVSVVVVAGVYRGLSATPLDVTAGTTSGTGTTLDSGAATTTNAHDLLVGIGAAQHNLSAGTGYTARTTNSIDILEDQEVLATGSYHATSTSTSGTVWLMQLIALRGAN